MLPPCEIPNRSAPFPADMGTLTDLLMGCSYQRKWSCRHLAVIYLLQVTANTIMSHFLSFSLSFFLFISFSLSFFFLPFSLSFFLSYFFLSPTPCTYSLYVLLLHPITGNDAHTDSVGLPWTRDRPVAGTSTISLFPY